MNPGENPNQNNSLTDQEILADALSSQKFTTSNLNNYANECAAPDLKKDFLNILEEEHQVQYDLFSEMQKRGWYPTPAAEQQKITQAKQKFENMSQNKMM